MAPIVAAHILYQKLVAFKIISYSADVISDCLVTVHDSCQDDLTACIRGKKGPLTSSSQFYAPASSPHSAERTSENKEGMMLYC